MNVLAVSELWPPASGTFVFEQIKALAPFVSITVAVLIPHTPQLPLYRTPHANVTSPVRMPELDASVEIYYLPYQTIPELGKYLNSLQARRVLARFLNQHKGRFDLIHAHFAYVAGFAAVSAGRHAGIPVLVTAYGSDINVYTRHNPRNLAAARFTVWGLRNAAAITALSEDLKKKIAAFGIPDHRITVLPPGIRQNIFFPRGEKRPLRRQLQLPENNELFLFVGNLVAVKGIEFLLEAFARRQRSLAKPATLALVGSGVLEQTLKQRAKALGLDSHIVWQEKKAHAEIPLWMSAADFLILPSLSEGYGLVLLESLACGTPVIASRVGGVPEILISPDFGPMVPPRDSAALAQAMIEAAAKKWDAQKLVNYAHQHTWTERAQRYLKVYRRVLEQRPASSGR